MLQLDFFVFNGWVDNKFIKLLNPYIKVRGSTYVPLSVPEVLANLYTQEKLHLVRKMIGDRLPQPPPPLLQVPLEISRCVAASVIV